MYRLLRPLLFSLSPECSHELTLQSLKLSRALGVTGLLNGSRVRDDYSCMGLTFPNRVGLAAGLDKNAACINGWTSLGFGFVEVGTVTPLAQPGNPAPRLFRLAEHEAIINRMGFNNEGLAALLANVKRARNIGVDAPLGINIGKNKNTPQERAVDDYTDCLKQVYAMADYITVNLSSPNTPGLRDLQFGDELDKLLSALQQCRAELQEMHSLYRPMLVKVAPDMADDDLKGVADKLVAHEFDGIIATNTTIDKSGVQSHRFANEAGGLSGAVLFDKSTESLRVLAEHLNGAMALIGVGGINSANRAVEKIQAGADLVQLYSGLIYEGPGLISDCAKAIANQR